MNDVKDSQSRHVISYDRLRLVIFMQILHEGEKKMNSYLTGVQPSQHLES